jgi:hypothetical protein
MYRSKILNWIKLDYFLKFVIHELNSEMVNSGMVVLIERENTDVTDAGVAVGWKLQPAIGIVVDEREREIWHDVSESEIQPSDH